jgi:hypothetical protein
MSEWGRGLYGEPCRECGYSWTIDPADARALVAAVPGRLAESLDAAGATGRERHPDLTWSVTAYVAHVGDNLRIWAERLAGITAGGSNVVASFDEDELAAVRSYDRLTLPAVRWSLERAARDWSEVVAAAPADLVMVHSERGPIGLAEVVRMTTHDAVHHLWDIDRTLAAS